MAKNPRVRERDIVNATLAMSAVMLMWRESTIDEETKSLDAVQEEADRLLKLIKQFRQEQLC